MSNWEAERDAKRALMNQRLDALATELAKLCNGVWTNKVAKDGEVYPGWRVITIPGRTHWELDLHMYERDTRVRASGRFPVTPRDVLNSVRYDGRELPEANVAWDRDPQAAAKDIHRRLYAPYTALLSDVVAAMQKLEGETLSISINFEALQEMCPDISLTSEGKRAKEANRGTSLEFDMYRSEGGYIREGSVSDKTVRMTLVELPLTKAARILAIMNEADK